MQYLKRSKGKGHSKSAIHLWVEEDTACRLWSTGGIRKKDEFEVFDSLTNIMQRFPRRSQKICANCEGAYYSPGAVYERDRLRHSEQKRDDH